MISSANATIVDNGFYTTDTATGLDFLDLNTVSSNIYAAFSGGTVYDGRTWELATIKQLDSLFTGIVGYNVSHGGIVSTFNFTNPGDANSIMDLIGTVSMIDTGWNYVFDNGLYNSLKIHDQQGLNDTHRTKFASGSVTNAFLVSNARSVPEPSAIALMGLGFLSFVASRRKQKKN